MGRIIPEPKLHVPGPTPVPFPIWQAMLEPMANHRSDAASAMRASIEARLRALWQARGPVLVLPASGTGGLESAVTNTVGPGTRVLAVSAGAFGDRFGRIAERAGAEVDWLQVPWGEAADPDAVRKRVTAGPRYDGVLLTQNETSTGVLQPIPDIVAAVRDHVDLILVDSISGSPAVPVYLDPWGVDVVVTASQKGFMLPPGLAMLGLSERVTKVRRGRPGVYFDWAGYIDQPWPYTPALSLLRGLDRSLHLLDDESPEERLRRHATMAAMVRAAGEALGFRPAAAVGVASPTVTALYPPEGISADELRREVSALGVVLAGGQGAWRGRVVRVGHVGAPGPLDMVAVVAALERAVANLAGRAADGRGVAAALRAWQA